MAVIVVDFYFLMKTTSPTKSKQIPGMYKTVEEASAARNLLLQCEPDPDVKYSIITVKAH